MIINRIDSLEEYQRHVERNRDKLKLLENIDNKLKNKINNNSKFYIDGYSWTSQTNSKFLVDLLYSDGRSINLRERLVCQKTSLNNRVRGCIHIFEKLFRPKLKDEIYLTEQSSLLAKWMSKKYPKLTTSEYLSDCSLYYKIRLALKIFPKKICHQDLTTLGFNKERFKFILSFDCFEHIPDYKQAFREINRTLKPDGKLLFSVPFDLNSKKNLIRACIENGNIKHLVEPEYHGDPVSMKGCLSYYTFGWELLNDLREQGFNNVYILLYWSRKFCYLGGEQILICAEK